LSLKQQALSGVKWTSISSIIITVIQLIQLSILAHYLEASDFGLIAIVTVIIGFSALFMDLGISASIIHKQDITYVQLSSLYWLNIASGILLFMIVYSFAPLLANFYNEIELIPLIRLLAMSFIISSFGNQYGLLFQKALKFNLMAKISIISAIAGFVVAVSLAVNGYGVYALVQAFLASAVVTTVINIAIGIKEHRPSFIFKYREITPMISFGMFQMGERGINYFNSQFDVILIGKLLGVEALGIYTVAKNLAMRPAQIINPIITKVTFPIMAKVQHDTVQLKNIYLKTINYLSSINFPIYILLTILAEPIVLTLFGSKWSDSIIILQILSIYGAFRSIGNPMGSLLLARGRANLGFYWNLGLFFFIPLAIYIGSHWGLNGVAYSLLGLMVVLVIPSWYFMVKPLCGAGFKEYFLQILKALIFAIIGGISAYGMSLLFGMGNMYLNTILIAGVMGVVVFMLNVWFNREFMDILKQFFQNGKNI